MGILKIIKEIILFVASELAGRFLLGSGIFLLLFGGILAYAITHFVLSKFGVEVQTVNLFSIFASIITTLLGVASFVLGILLLIWVRKRP